MIRIVIAIAFSALLWCGAQAQFSYGPNYGNKFGFNIATTAGSPPPSTTNWNGSDLVNMTLSGGNLVATGNNASDGSVRAVANHSTGKYYYEATLTVAGAGGDSSCGIANASASLANAPNSTLLIASAYQGSGGIWVNGANLGSITAFSVTNVAGVAVDTGGQLIWIRNNNGNWNGSGAADPATGAGGFSISGITAAYYPWCSANGAGSGNTSWTANFGATSFANAAPSGFGNW